MDIVHPKGSSASSAPISKTTLFCMIFMTSLVTSLLTAGIVVGVFVAVYDENSSTPDLSNSLSDIESSLQNPVAPKEFNYLGHGVDPDTIDRRRRLTEGSVNLGVLDMPPKKIEALEALSVVIPFDWECQAATSGGVYPCPNGISSECRYAENGIDDSCVKCICGALTRDSDQPKCCDQLSSYTASDCEARYQISTNHVDTVYGDTDWIDTQNDTCKGYAENPSWCTSYVLFSTRHSKINAIDRHDTRTPTTYCSRHDTRKSMP